MFNMSRVFWSVFLVAHLASISMATPFDAVPIRTGGLSRLSLSPFVRYWEAARYERRARGGRRERRRTLSAPVLAPPIRISFKAHNREFNLQLRPDAGSVFAQGAEFHNTHGTLAYDTGQVYSGKLEDDDASMVYGIITSDGLFDGTIITKLEEFYVEPISRYNLQHPHIHSIIYKESDVLHPNRNSSVPCTSHVLYVARKNKHPGSIFKLKNQGITREEMYNVIDVDSEVNYVKLDRKKRWLPEEEGDFSSTSDTYNVMQEDEPRRNPELPLDLDVPYTRNVKEDHDKTSSTRKPKSKTGIENLVFKNRGIIVNTFDRNSSSDSPNSSRPKPKNHVEIIKSNSGVNSNVIKKDVVNKKPVGFTVISALPANINDSSLRHVNKRATVDPKKTTCMLYLQADHMFYQRYGSEEACIDVMTRHVQKVNAIYRVTDFNQDGVADNITFMIKRIKVHTLDALKDPHYRFPGNYGVEKYLELFSEEDYDAFCLAYMFTYRDFEMGTLGLAWTGDLKNAGGVCEKNGHYRGSLKSLNTGIVTLLNYGKHVPPAVSHVTLAHEIGHNFGSPHDPEVCTPGGEDGNFIMFARATSGDKKNNNRFSPCSLRSIDPVLNTKARSSKGCFTEAAASICGNGVVEAGEQCDCGWAGECNDACCRPQRARPPPGYRACTLTPASLCSPSQGPCCTSQCTLKFGERCREDNGCRDASHCDGRRAACPPSRHKPNRTRCDDEFVCYMGECTGSICLAYGLESCQCMSGAGDSATKACELCCRTPAVGPAGSPAGPCRSSFQWNRAPYDVPDMHAKPGTPCNDYNGYCDVFAKCREVDPSGPLATLRRLLLSDESMASFRRWILDHWYAVLLVILAIVALLMASTRWLGRSADPKLQGVTIMHSSTTETVRLPDQDAPVILHAPVRSKVPLNKKVMLKSGMGRHKARNNPDSTTNPENERKKVKDGSKVTSEQTKSKKSTPTKQKSKNKTRKSKVKKEVIDYSSLQKETAVPQPDNEALGKVQKWLLSSPPPPSTAAVPKSKSTPVGLAERAYKPKLPTVLTKKGTRPFKSAGNLNSNDKEKARLQVIYKPPFKFSLKLCKGDRTKVVLDKYAQPRLDAIKRKNDPVSTDHSPTENPRNTPQTDTAREKPIVNIAKTVQKKTEIASKASKKIDSSDKSYVNIGQAKDVGESKQSLISQDQLTSTVDGTLHLYENALAVKEAYLPRSCSMPRRNHSHGIGKNIISRQSSYSHLPRAHVRPQKANAVEQDNASQDDLRMQHSYSSLNTLHRNSSQNGRSGLSEGSSLNNISNGVPRTRFSMPGEIYNNASKRSRQNSLVEKSKPSRRWSGMDRQLSDDLSVPGQRMELCMPKSAGADPSNVNLTGFQWNVSGKRLCVDFPENRHSGDGLGSAERLKVNSAVPNSSVRNRVSPVSLSVIKDSHKAKQQTSRGVEGWPHTFGDLKNALPDCNSDLNTSDMEVLLSDDEFLKKPNI